MYDDRYFDGTIYSVKIYEGALYEEKIKENHNANIERFLNSDFEGQEYKDYSKEGLDAWYDAMQNIGEDEYDYSKSTWSDLTKNNKDATISGTTNWKKEGLYLNGNTIVNMNSILMPKEDDFTIEIVMSLYKYPSEYAFIMGQNTSSSDSNRFGLMYSKKDNQLCVQSGSNVIKTDYNPQLEEKTTITIVRNNNLEIWINGEKKVTEDFTGKIIYQGNTILGRWGMVLNRYFNGNIYSLRKYNRTLSEEEIKQNYNTDKLRF